MKRIFPFFSFALLLTSSALFAADDVSTKSTLTLEGAKKVGLAAESAARKFGASGAIAVVDDGGHLLYFERLAGTFLGSPAISIGKAKTAVEFKKPTREFEEIIAKGRFAMTALPDFTPLQGGIPIFQGDQIIGAIGVSGAKTAAQDEEIAIAGASAFSAETR